MLLRYIFFFSLLLLTTLGISPSAGFSGFMSTAPNTVYGGDGKTIASSTAKVVAELGKSADKVAKGVTRGVAGVPGRVQSRINLKKGRLKHTLDRHLNPASSGSQFSLSKDEVVDLLQSKQVVDSPITRVLDSGNFLREVNVGRNIGFDKYNGNRATSTLSVITDKSGNLLTAIPGKVK